MILKPWFYLKKIMLSMSKYELQFQEAGHDLSETSLKRAFQLFCDEERLTHLFPRVLHKMTACLYE